MIQLGAQKNEKGLLVGQVELGSPAYQAGLRQYDFITKIDDKAVQKFSDLKSAVVKKGVGKKVRLNVLRQGKPPEFDVLVGESPQS